MNRPGFLIACAITLFACHRPTQPSKATVPALDAAASTDTHTEPAAPPTTVPPTPHEATKAVPATASISIPFTMTNGPMLAIDENGGCDMHRAMCSHFRVEADGRITAHNSGNVRATLTNDQAHTLQQQIDAFDFAGHAWAPAKHGCEAPADGVDTIYTFRQSNGHTFSLRDCGVDVDVTTAPFTIITNAESLAASPQ